jgi:hypothetical protein
MSVFGRSLGQGHGPDRIVLSTGIFLGCLHFRPYLTDSSEPVLQLDSGAACFRYAFGILVFSRVIVSFFPLFRTVSNCPCTFGVTSFTPTCTWLHHQRDKEQP